MASNEIHTCPQCQAEILYNVQFCPNCGNWLGAQAPGSRAPRAGDDRSAPEEAGAPPQAEGAGRIPPQNEQDFVVQVINRQVLCPHCGQLHPESMDYCPVTALPIRDSERLCSNCGARVSPTASFCTGCGSAIIASDQTQVSTGQAVQTYGGVPTGSQDRTARSEAGGAVFQPVQGAQAVQGDIYATQQMAYGGQPGGYAAPATGTVYPESGTGSARGLRGRYIWLLAAGGALVILCLLCVGIGLGSNLESILGIFSSPTPEATSTATPTATAISTHTATPIPSATQTQPPTLTYTPQPSETTSPTDTPRPTDTPSETAYYWVKIRNKFSSLVFAFRDGKQMGRDPIPLGKYIQYKIPAGTYTFHVCIAESNDCSSNKTVTVNSDLEIVFP